MNSPNTGVGIVTGAAFQISCDSICKLLEIWEAALLKF